MNRLSPREQALPGFTLVEMLTATAVLALLVVLLSSATSSTLTTIQRAHAKVGQYAGARAAFDQLTETLSDATLSPYWDSATASGSGKYGRRSDLHFVIKPAEPNLRTGEAGVHKVFFQAPLGYTESGNDPASGLLNAVGYWIDYGSDEDWRPGHITEARNRYRLMARIQPAKDLDVYGGTDDSWTKDLQTTNTTPANEIALPVAENVIAMILLPRLPKLEDSAGTVLSGDYRYDSRTGDPRQLSQLPPVVQVTFIVIDEVSAARLDTGSSSEPNAIQSALSGRFTSVANYENDLAAVKQSLDDARIGYRVLTAPVALREAQWSLTP